MHVLHFSCKHSCPADTVSKKKVVHIKKYFKLISCFLVGETDNELLMKIMNRILLAQLHSLKRMWHPILKKNWMNKSTGCGQLRDYWRGKYLVDMVEIVDIISWTHIPTRSGIAKMVKVRKIKVTLWLVYVIIVEEKFIGHVYVVHQNNLLTFINIHWKRNERILKPIY